MDNCDMRERGGERGLADDVLRAYCQEHDDCVKYSGAWYRALVAVGCMTFADVVEVTGLPVSDVVNMLEK